MKTILITGCSSGIGREAASQLRERGWRVFASCRNLQDCERLRADGFESPLIDYENEASIDLAVQEVATTTGGRLDALFNNGAYAIPGPLEDIPSDAMRAIFQANVIGWHHLTNRVIPLMRTQGYGRIINNSSVLGLVGARWRGAYVASKFAVEGMSDVLRMEMSEFGIHVILIEPGPIRTDFRKNAVAQFKKWVDWETSARRVEYQASLLDKLNTGSKGKSWPATAVTDRLIQALEARNPQARYFVTTPTYAAGALRRLLPTRLLDRILLIG